MAGLVNLVGYTMRATESINVAIELFGSALSLIIIFCIIIGGQSGMRLNRLYMLMLMANVAVLLSDAAAILCKGDDGLFSFVAVRIANFGVFSLGYVLYAAFTQYLYAFIGERTSLSPHIPRIAWTLCLVAILLVVLSQFTGIYYSFDEMNIYHRGPMYWLSQVLGLAGMAVNLWVIFSHRKSLERNDLLILLSYVLLPVVAIVVQIWMYGIALLYITSTLCVLMMYVGLQGTMSRRIQAQELRLKEAELALKQKELALTQGRIDIMLTQIRPHFLFNALSAIGQLCDQDPQQAKEAVLDFSSYLRTNLDALTQRRPVPLQEELNHTRTYLALESRRFEGRLHIKWDIQADAFTVPPLSVQPIVENAVRHGVLKKPGCGTIKIQSMDGGDCWLVIVGDNGMGFDPGKPPADGRTHTGLDNVRYRLENMCGGSLIVESVPGQGTQATIRIPKKRRDEEQ